MSERAERERTGTTDHTDQRQPLFARTIHNQKQQQQPSTNRQPLFPKPSQQPSETKPPFQSAQQPTKPATHPPAHQKPDTSPKTIHPRQTQPPQTTTQKLSAQPYHQHQTYCDIALQDNQAVPAPPPRTSRPSQRLAPTFLDLPDEYDDDVPEDVERIYRLQQNYEETSRLRYQLEHQMAAQSWLDVPGYMLPRVKTFARTQPYTLAAIAIISIIILVLLGPTGQSKQLSHWIGPLQPFVNQLTSAIPFINTPSLPPPLPVGDYRLHGSPSVTADEIDIILSSYNSPAAGTGTIWFELGKTYNIDPAYALAFFIHESTAGTHPQWAGNKSDGTTTHNIGNIICAGYSSCYGRFRDYPSWEEGIEDWFRLINDEYIEGRGMQTVDEVLPVYAPSFENDVEGYNQTVQKLVDSWRMGAMRGRGLTSYDAKPQGNPLQASNTVMTQGYGIGSHAPANVWGAIDLAIDSNNDGEADPNGTWGQPIYATHSGVVRVSSNTWPAGNHIWIMNLEYKTGYAHLQDFAVQDGQLVQRGDLIGHVGSSGQSSGPHLDYQTWHKQQGTWVNINPQEFDALVH